MSTRQSRSAFVRAVGVGSLGLLAAACAPAAPPAAPGGNSTTNTAQPAARATTAPAAIQPTSAPAPAPVVSDAVKYNPLGGPARPQSPPGVPARPFFYPLSSLPAYPGAEAKYREKNPRAYDISSSAINRRSGVARS